MPISADSPKGRMKRWIQSEHWIIIILLVSGFMRFVYLDSWPAVMPDEGLWTNSTKNFIMFGDWFMDGRKHVFLSPVFHMLSLVSFYLLGPSIYAARLVTALLGMISIVLLYLLVRRASGNSTVAVLTAVVFGINQWTMFVSRTALVEPAVLSFLIGSVYLATYRTNRCLVGAGAILGFALLTKLNIGFMLPVMVYYLLFGEPFSGRAELRGGLIRVTIYIGTALAVAGLGYYSLYSMDPVRFVEAFRFELDGVHFESISQPLIRIGRFGLDPAQACRTIIALFRESPFMCVLCSVGVTQEFVRRSAAIRLFLLWFIVGTGFFLFQMYQTHRYFFLVAPAFAYYAALAIQMFAAADDRKVASFRKAVVVATYLLFEIGHVGYGVIVNRDNRLYPVVSWAHANTRPTDRLMAAGYFCTDLRRQAYAHYYYTRSEQELVSSIEQLQIDYVIYDKGEWGDAPLGWLETRYPVVKEWSFGVVYKIKKNVGESESGTDDRSLTR